MSPQLRREEQQLQRFIRLQDLPAFVGLKRSVINDLVRDGKFPRPIQLTDNGRAVAWLESEVLAWQAERIAKRRNERMVVPSKKKNDRNA